MDPVVTAKKLGELTITRKPENVMNKNQRALVQKANISHLMLPPGQPNVTALKILPSIPKMELVLKSLRRDPALKER